MWTGFCIWIWELWDWLAHAYIPDSLGQTQVSWLEGWPHFRSWILIALQWSLSIPDRLPLQPLKWGHPSNQDTQVHLGKPVPLLMLYSVPSSGIERCEGAINSGLDIHQFVASSDSTLPSRRPFLFPVGVAKPSPILARKASVIEEWSNLQRTRALSQSESDKKNVPSPIASSSSVSTSPPLGSSPSATPPGHTPSNGSAATAGSVVSPGKSRQNGTGSGGSGLGMEESRKFLSARYDNFKHSGMIGDTIKGSKSYFFWWWDMRGYIV